MAEDAEIAALPEARPRFAAGETLHHVAVLALGLAALAAALHGLGLVLRNRVGLEVLYGGWTLGLGAALAAGAACAALALARRGAAWARRGWRETSLAPLRAALCVAVAGWVAYAASWQPFQRLTFDLALGLTAAAWAGWLALRPPSPAPPTRAWRAFDFVLFQAALVVAGLEAGLRAWVSVVPTPLLMRHDESSVARIREFRIEPGRMHLGFPHNSRGYYDEEFGPRRPGVTRVVSLSDSFGFGIVPHAHHFTTVAEERCADVEVLNMGVPAVGPPEYLHLLRTEVPVLAPDLVVVCLFLGNDVAFEGHRTQVRLDPGLRSWFDREELLTIMAVERRVLLAAERRRLAEHGGPIAGVWGAGEVHGRVDGPLALAEAFPWNEDPLLETPGMSEEGFMTCELARGRDTCSTGPEFYAPLFAVLEELRLAAGGTPLAVLLIPDELQVEDELWQAVVAGLPGLALERERPQRLVGAWLAERGVPYVDLLPRLRAVEPLGDGRRHVYHLRDTHFNRRGNAVAGEELARLIEAALSR